MHAYNLDIAMPSLDIMIAFIAATAVFAYMPGPAMLYAAAQTMARGHKAGWLAAFGIHIGGYVHVAAAALGLAVLFEAVPVLYTVLKIIGALYLFWLGARLLLSRPAAKTEAVKIDAKSTKRSFWESITVEILNPKTAIFYLAFLPQFTDPAASFPVWLQLFILGTVVNIMFSSADVIAVVLSGKIMTSLQRSASSAAVVRKLGGSILIALGVNLALTRQ